MSVVHDGFVTTGKRLFEFSSFPMQLYQKAKRLGIWNPADLDFSEDKLNWHLANDSERDATLGTVAVFQAGEEAVTLDLLPLIMAVALENRIEEELYLTTFLFEEAKHTEFFQRWLAEVPEKAGENLEHYMTPSYRAIFYEELPAAMWALKDDPSPENQLRASVTYNMIVEGVLAETGYFGFFYQLQQTGESLLPGLLEGLTHVRRDESRHLAYGIYLISRLVAENPKLWDAAVGHMTRLLPLAMAFVDERLKYHLERYGSLPNDVDPQLILNYASGQYQKRFSRLEKARNQSLQEIERIALETTDEAA